MKKVLCVRYIVFLCSVMPLCTGSLYAQYVEIKTNTTEEKPKDSIIKIKDISELFDENPGQYYRRYVDTLLAQKKFKNAEKLVQDKMKEAPAAHHPIPVANPGRPNDPKSKDHPGISSQDPLLYIDMGHVYDKEGKETKAKDQFEKVFPYINGDDMITREFAKAFIDINKPEYAVKVYEKASGILGNPYYYGIDLANLYSKTGRMDNAIDILLAGNQGLNANVEGTKTTLLQLLGSDPGKLQQVQKIIIQKINEHPDNIYFEEILTWIYTQKNDWDGALMQIEAIDERNREQGRRLLDFARNALNEKQYAIADKAYSDVIAKGADMPLYITAKSEQLSEGFTRLKNDPADTGTGITDNLEKRYSTFLAENPAFNPATIAADYAEIEAAYANNVEKAINILEKVVYRSDLQRAQAGKLKLQLGDYYLLQGKLWDASLTYSQVDKEFKQDAMGEDARFRNAKLAYYRGDFAWAQRQLYILKSATSELISNDAIALSVLITENVEDSVTYPLIRFAHAGLLFAQNKDKDATELLDSIAKAFPKHPLIDDILMQHAMTEEKHHNYEKAIGYLEQIHKEYGTDVLGDDAVFKMAEIYENDLRNKDKAKEFYEQLILEYPGSTFVQSARQRLQEINNPSTP